MNSLSNIPFVGYKVHLGEDINMRQFKLYHSRKRCHTPTYELGHISDKLIKI
jgi:hypothetical protein